jgi:hypothetical protein
MPEQHYDASKGCSAFWEELAGGFVTMNISPELIADLVKDVMVMVELQQLSKPYNITPENQFE